MPAMAAMSRSRACGFRAISRRTRAWFVRNVHCRAGSPPWGVAIVVLVRSASGPVIAVLSGAYYEVDFRYRLTCFCPTGILEACGWKGGPCERTLVMVMLVAAMPERNAR